MRPWNRFTFIWKPSYTQTWQQILTHNTINIYCLSKYFEPHLYSVSCIKMYSYFSDILFEIYITYFWWPTFDDLFFIDLLFVETYLAPELLPVYSLSMNGPSSSELVVVGTTTYLPLGRIMMPNTLLDLLYSDANTFSPTMCTLYFLFSST